MPEADESAAAAASQVVKPSEDIAPVLKQPTVYPLVPTQIFSVIRKSNITHAHHIPVLEVHSFSLSILFKF